MRLRRPGMAYDWRHGRPPGRLRVAALLVWLGFILAPIIDALTARGHSSAHWLALAGAVAFSASYVWLVITWIDMDVRMRGYALSLFQLTVQVTGEPLTLGARSPPQHPPTAEGRLPARRSARCVRQ